MPVIVEANINYADEFDTFGFRLYRSKEEFEEEYEKWSKEVLSDYYSSKDVKKFLADQSDWDEWWSKTKTELDLDNDIDFEKWRWETYNKTKKYYEPRPQKYQMPKIEVYFGTNEALTFSPEDIPNLIKEFSIIEISGETYKELKKKFNGRGLWLMER